MSRWRSIAKRGPEGTGESLPDVCPQGASAPGEHVQTALPASSVEGKMARKVRVASGRPRSRTVASVTTPSSPSLPTTAARRS